MQRIIAIVCVAGLSVSATATPPELIDLGPGYGSWSNPSIGYDLSMPIAGLTRGVNVAKANNSAVAWGYFGSTFQVNKYVLATATTSTITPSNFSVGAPVFGALSTDGSTVYGYTYDLATSAYGSFEWNPAASPAISNTTNQWSGYYPIWYASATGQDSNGPVVLLYTDYDSNFNPPRTNVIRRGTSTLSWEDVGTSGTSSGPAYFAMTADGSKLAGYQQGSDEQRFGQRSGSDAYAVVKRGSVPELILFGSTNAHAPSFGYGIDAAGTLAVGHTIYPLSLNAPCTGAYGQLGFIATIPSSTSQQITASLLSPLSLFPEEDCSWIVFGANYGNGPTTRAFDVGGDRAVGHVSPGRFPVDLQNEYGYTPGFSNAVVWTTSLYPYNLQQWADARIPSNATERLLLKTALSISHDGQVIAGHGTLQTRSSPEFAWSNSGERAWVINLGECPLFKSCPGDLNLDGIVDDADFTLFGIAYENITCGPCCLADTNFDAMVDDADFSDFAVSYGALLCEDHPNIHRIDSIPDNP